MLRLGGCSINAPAGLKAPLMVWKDSWDVNSSARRGDPFCAWPARIGTCVRRGTRVTCVHADRKNPRSFLAIFPEYLRAAVNWLRRNKRLKIVPAIGEKRC